MSTIDESRGKRDLLIHVLHDSHNRKTIKLTALTRLIRIIAVNTYFAVGVRARPCAPLLPGQKKKQKKNGDYPTERKKWKKEKKNKEKTTTTAQHLPVPLDQHLLELIG